MKTTKSITNLLSIIIIISWGIGLYSINKDDRWFYWLLTGIIMIICSYIAIRSYKEDNNPIESTQELHKQILKLAVNKQFYFQINCIDDPSSVFSKLKIIKEEDIDILLTDEKIKQIIISDEKGSVYKLLR